MKIKPLPREKRKQDYWKNLNQVIDPDLGIGIVDLGLIYDVKIKNKIATVYMTLTSPICPYGPMLISQVEETMEELKEIKKAKVKMIWDPPWQEKYMNPEIKSLVFGD